MKFSRILFLALSMILLAACNFTLAADVTPPPGYQPPPIEETPQTTSGPLYPILPPDPAQGETIFADKCAPCHGDSGLGDGPRASQLPNPVPPIGSAAVARQATPARWFEIVTQGNLERFMPPFQSLTDRQRWDVVAYIYSLSASRADALQGAEIYQEHCVDCHGPQGAGDGQLAAELPSPVRDISDQEFMSGKSSADLFQAISQGVEPAMPAFEDALPEPQRWLVADYLRWLTFSSTGQITEEQVAPTLQADTAMEITPSSEVTTTAQLTETVDLIESTALTTVSGYVMNSSGGEVPSGLPVMLHGFDHTQIVITGTTTLDADGSFTFSDIEVNEGQVFLATIDFEGVTYGSEALTAQTDGEDLELPIQVFDTTSNSSTLSVDRVHYFFELIDPNVVRIVELYIISNPTGKTLVAPSEGQPVLAFSLPPDAANLEFQDGTLGGRYIQTTDGFGDTFPIRPGMGNHQIMFSYELPFRRSLEFSRPVQLNTNAVVILMPEDGLKVRGETIADAGIRDVQGVQYHLYDGSEMAAGSTLLLTISENTSLFSSTSFTGLLLGAAALGLVLIGAGVWLYRRTSVTDVTAQEIEENPPEPAEESAETLMDAILALDDLYKEGKLRDEAYLERREALKSRLKDLLDE